MSDESLQGIQCLQIKRGILRNETEFSAGICNGVRREFIKNCNTNSAAISRRILSFEENKLEGSILEKSFMEQQITFDRKMFQNDGFLLFVFLFLNEMRKYLFTYYVKCHLMKKTFFYLSKFWWTKYKRKSDE